MDGARLGCALHSGRLGAAMVVETGIDILSFGGTKQGMMCGEAVIILKPGLAARFSLLAEEQHAIGLENALYRRAIRRPAG